MTVVPGGCAAGSTAVGAAPGRCDRRLGDGRYRGQRFAAKAERDEHREVVCARDFAGAMARQGERQLVGRDAVAVVANQDPPDTAVVELDVDAAGTGVECVFDEFLDDRGRAFNDFTGRNLVDHRFRQRSNHAGVHGR